MLYAWQGQAPQFENEADWQGFVADSAQLIGPVWLGQRASVWFGAVVRADNHVIRIGADSNIQENAVLHTDAGVPLELGQGVTVGHLAMLHGCQVGDYSLIGIHAVVLNGARIGRFCIVGANALVTEGQEIPDYSLVVGSPARVIRTFEPAQIEARLMFSAGHYVQKGLSMHEQLQAVVPPWLHQKNTSV